MVNPIDCRQLVIEKRDFLREQEVCLVMDAKSPLTSSESQLLTLQTGQLLVAIGSLIASQPVTNGRASKRTSRNLIKIGRKLLAAGKCPRNF
jgi:hypothetical protein